MATYAIGDVQGCYDSLRRLLNLLPWDPARDRVWLVGDLVNRGPKSLEVLRWARSMGESVQMVLGNHDVHLLRSVCGLRRKRRDTLRQVLEAPDCAELIEWLRRQPLMVREGTTSMVHAGIHPAWSIDDAMARAAEVEAWLGGDDWQELLSNVSPSWTPPWRDELAGWARTASILSIFLSLRTCHADGRLCPDFVGPPADAPPGCVPWFEVPGRKWAGNPVVFGHWSTLGLDMGPDHLALDTGCVWGGSLTAVRLEDRQVFSVEASD